MAGFVVMDITQEDYDTIIRNKAIDGIMKKAEKWNLKSSKKVPYIFVKWLMEEMKEGVE
ncbi:MAG: hypothetical protein J6A75_02570 [Lachnospiraceae bacterium]|nr:hypothetical protein [Lachnospiraceae bacterium]